MDQSIQAGQRPPPSSRLEAYWYALLCWSGFPQLSSGLNDVKESDHLGPLQRKILDLLENELDGLTTDQMLEEIYRIPTMLITLLHVSTDFRFF